MESFIKDTQNQSNLFALFYFHVIRVDAFEDSIKNPLKKLLEKYELNQKYDVEEIFSVKQKVKRKDNRYITDIRAVRNFLAHFQFEILDNQDEWKIHFKSGDSPKDKIIFDETFSKEQLVEFLNNSNILYQSQFMLTLLLSGITHFKAFAKEPLLVHQLSI